MVTLTDIGENRAALFCLTNRATCYTGSNTGASGHSVWLLPCVSSVISLLGVRAGMFYRSRGASAVLLYHGIATLEPSGVFPCNIADSADLHQQVFVGI